MQRHVHISLQRQKCFVCTMWYVSTLQSTTSLQRHLYNISTMRCVQRRCIAMCATSLQRLYNVKRTPSPQRLYNVSTTCIQRQAYNVSTTLHVPNLYNIVHTTALQYHTYNVSTMTYVRLGNVFYYVSNVFKQSLNNILTTSGVNRICNVMCSTSQRDWLTIKFYFFI